MCYFTLSDPSLKIEGLVQKDSCFWEMKQVSTLLAVGAYTKAFRGKTPAKSASVCHITGPDTFRTAFVHWGVHISRLHLSVFFATGSSGCQGSSCLNQSRKIKNILKSLRVRSILIIFYVK